MKLGTAIRHNNKKKNMKIPAVVSIYDVIFVFLLLAGLEVLEMADTSKMQYNSSSMQYHFILTKLETSEAYLEPCQTCWMEIFLQGNLAADSCDYTGKAAPSQMFEKALNTL